MAIALVSSSNGGYTSGSPATYTLAFNVTETSANHLLVVGVFSSHSTEDTIASVTYNGDAMTRAVANYNVGNGYGASYIYYLLNPDTGNNNIVVTQTATKGDYIGCAPILYSGVASSNIVDDTDVNNGSGTAVSITSTVSTENSWMVGMCYAQRALSAGSKTTIRGVILNSIVTSDKNAPLATGNQTLNLTHKESQAWNFVSMVFKPATATAYTVSCSEALSLTDIISRSTHFNKSISETLSMTEAVSKSQGMSKSLTETLSLSDAISSAIQRGLLLLETLHITDTLQRTTRFAKTLTESISLTDTLASAKQFFVNLSETIGLTDVISKSTNFAKTLSETLHLTDVIKVTGWWWNYLFKRTSSYDYKSKSTNTWDSKTKSKNTWIYKDK
jgi:hypothetical protein